MTPKSGRAHARFLGPHPSQIRHLLGVVFCTGRDLAEGLSDLGGEGHDRVGNGTFLGNPVSKAEAATCYRQTLKSLASLGPLREAAARWQTLHGLARPQRHPTAERP